MCMFTRPVRWVGSTSIFARIQDGHQVLIYSMELIADQETAMVLPVPLHQGAFEFVNLEGYPDFFEHLSLACRPHVLLATESRGLGLFRERLPIEKVGSFEASYVPSARDFDRLDERFRLPAPLSAALMRYRGCGFAVFQLAAGKQKIHPVAMRFPTNQPNRLFFPTLHLHGRFLWPLAHYDHSLYCQIPKAPAGWRPGGVEKSEVTGNQQGSIRLWMEPTPAQNYLDIARTQGLVDEEAMCYHRFVKGYRPNRDYFV